MAVSAAVLARRRRAPLMALALVALFAGLWGGLIRLGLSLPSAVTSSAELHGPLMALGFLGTLISLERAVALARPWAYVAPLAAGAGALAALAGAPGSLGPVLLALAGTVLIAAHVVLHRLQPSTHNVVMGLGGVAWLAAAVLWTGGADVSRFAPLLAGFLVLTIVGERLELTRAMRRSDSVRRLLIAAVTVFVVGLAISVFAERTGVRIAGIGLLAQAAWLARYDAARRTVRTGGLTRYMAFALLAGYVWLACTGVLWTAYAALGDGAAYDASLHAVFLGFVMSMVFAHAPVIVPAVLRVPVPYTRGFYAQLALLHLSLALRLLGGDRGHASPCPTSRHRRGWAGHHRRSGEARSVGDVPHGASALLAGAHEAVHAGDPDGCAVRKGRFGPATAGRAIRAVSNQLQRLVDRRILAARREGLNVFYRVVDPCVPALLELAWCTAESSAQPARVEVMAGV